MKYPGDKYPPSKITIPYSVRTKSAAEMLAAAKKQTKKLGLIKRLCKYFKL